MAKASQNKIGVPFEPLTAQKAKEWYQHKHLTTTGYLLAIKGITRPPGVDLVIPNVLAFCREWGITKSAFYRAVNALKASAEMDWEATEGLILKSLEPPGVVSIIPSAGQCPTSGTVSHERDCESHERDCESHERDCKSHERDCESHERDNRSLKPLPDMADSALQIIQTYSDFIQTLSDRERENFWEFGRKKASRMPYAVELPDRWIAKYWEEVRSEWEKTEPARKAKKDAAAAQANWRNDPRFDDWIWKAFNGGYPWTQENEAEREQRYAFWEWAQDTNAYEGVCYQ